MPNCTLHRQIILPLMILATLSACQTLPQSNSLPRAQSEVTTIPAIASSQIQTLADILPALANKPVVFVGESHDQYHHHLSQLAVIKSLYAQNTSLAIGLEFFQRPFQSHLDAYLADEIDEQTMLEKTEYFNRWRFDYRLYQPILAFAKKYKIPLIALNLSKEITQKVGRKGLKALTAEERAQIPTSIDRDVAGYRERIEAVFKLHPSIKERSIENFIDVQLLWDEGMAETAANYLQQNPQKKLVILAGSGHINYRSGIPTRLERRIQQKTVTIVPGDSTAINPSMADFILFPQHQSLPKRGLIGVGLEPADQGMKIASFSKTSKAKKAGLKKEDRIIKIENQIINNFADIQLAIWNKVPGDSIKITVLRNTETANNRTIELDVELTGLISH